MYNTNKAKAAGINRYHVAVSVFPLLEKRRLVNEVLRFAFTPTGLPCSWVSPLEAGLCFDLCTKPNEVDLFVLTFSCCSITSFPLGSGSFSDTAHSKRVKS